MSAVGLGTPPVNGHKYDSEHNARPSSAMNNYEDDDDLEFESPSEEADFYRDKYRVAIDLLNETRAELDEFQVSSRELEQELENELVVTEARQAELRDRANRLETEKEEWKTKFVNLQKSHSSTVAAMQREMDNLRSERDKTLVAIRDLEMGNDELERNERVAASSLLDMEIKYNRAIEEKTLLEQEVIAKQELEEECQRLKDDVRDANNEIAILRDQVARAAVSHVQASAVPMSPLSEFGGFSRPTSRSTMASPTPSDASASTRVSHSSQKSAGTDRESRSTTITPRTVRPSPRVPRTTSIPTLSPSIKRTAGTTASPGISGLTRSTTSRQLAGPTGVPGPSRRSVSTATTQSTRNKGFKLLHDLQARLKATDDKIGRNVKRNVSGPTQSRPSGQTTITASTMTAAHSRVSALSRTQPSQNTTTPTSHGVFSPSSWVMLSDVEDTPPVRRGGHDEPDSPSIRDPLRASVGPAGTKTSRMLPQRPGIPSPLAPTLSRAAPRLSSSTSGPTRPLRIASRPSGRPPLSVSTSHTSSSQLSSSSSRPPSRTHTRAGSRSGALSPTLIPKSRRSSLQSYPNDDEEILSSFHSSAASITSKLSSSSSRPPSRSENRSRAMALGRGPAPITPSVRKAPRRSSVGVDFTGAPPSGIPAPRTPGSRPSSVPMFTDAPPPPVPRIPSGLVQSRRRD